MSDVSNGLDRITRNEFEQAMGEMVANVIELQAAFNELKTAVNAQAEILGLYRYIFENFFPIERVAAAAKSYKDARLREIAIQTTQPANA